MFDIVICHGLVVDGTGKRAIRADVGISKGKITALGDLSQSEAIQKIDASEQIVSPGFIDVHTHTDVSIQKDNRSESQVRQGVTTELVGLCGYGFAPCTNETRELLFSAWSGETPQENWSSFAEYLQVLKEAQPGPNIACLVSHAALRYLAMGHSCARAATDAEIQVMVQLLDQSMAEGAFGLSTGLEYYPGKQAEKNELEALCAVLPAYRGVHASHVRNRDRYIGTSFMEVIELARNTHSRLQISHINPKYGRPEGSLQNLLGIISNLRTEGVDIGMDVMPTNWNYTAGKALLPNWANDLSLEGLLELLESREGRKKLSQNPTPIWQLPIEQKWDRIVHFSGSATLRYAGKSIAEIAEEKGCSGWDALCALLLEEGPEMGSLRLTGNSFFTEDIIEVLQDPYCSVCSDTIGAAIDGPFKDLRIAPNSYTWCERYLREFILEKKVLSLEEGIRRITSLPAEQIGLKNRGILAPGAFADLTVFSPKTLSDAATFANPNVYPEGISYVIINGSITLNHGVYTRSHSGQVLSSTQQASFG